MFQVNVFGQMRVTQAILPLFRNQGHGIIGFTSSGTAWAPMPFMSHYAASKAALSTYVESLHKEVRPLGIQCVAFECGGFPTRLGQPREESATSFGDSEVAISAYEPLLREFFGKLMANLLVTVPGDLSKAATRIIDVLKKEGIATDLPWAVRVAIGSDGYAYAKNRCEEQLKLLENWKDLSLSTDRVGAERTVVQDLYKFLTVLEG
jgi:short-subunit dehydrogenase